jgi:hypothetical protein
VSGVSHMAVNEKTDQLETSVSGALSKLVTSLEREFGRMESKRVRPGIQMTSSPTQDLAMD